MASTSRAAQEKLAELEKGSAPFEDQLVEAVKFIGGGINFDGKHGFKIDDPGKQPNSAAFHGREEWLLRWLLKKLQAPKDDIPRKTPASWRLLAHLLQTIPIPNAARILQERKFMAILRQTLEEAQKAASDTSRSISGDRTSSDSTLVEETSSKVSRKRKRSGELVTNPTGTGDLGLGELLEAIYEAIAGMQRSTNVNLVIVEKGRSAAFTTEYMKTVMRTTAEEAAKILGLWLSLSRILHSQRGVREPVGETWLSQFLQIWDYHAPGTDDLMQYSLHCSHGLISLLKAVKSGEIQNQDWLPILEEQVARNIILPAKAANLDDPESDLLNTLTRVSIIQDSANAPLQFEVAIRSIQPRGSRRRMPHDDAWLQTVFDTLVKAMPNTRFEQNSKAIRCMLHCAIDHKVSLELPALRSITSTYALSEGTTNWDLLHTIIILDANVFLIPDEEKNLLQEVLTRITTASVDPSWSEISGQVVTGVVVPLMKEFANARDLSGFIHHWFAQLVEFERLRKAKRKQPSTAIFSAWEDEALQVELSKLLEPSLTLRQITDILEFLNEQVAKSPDAVCVILEAIASSISHAEVVDAVQLRLYHIMFDNMSSEKLDSRYKWRSWRILSRSLSWMTSSGLNEIVKLWEEQAKPFDLLSGRLATGRLLEAGDGNTIDLETLESLRCICAAWETVEEWSPLKSLAKPSMLNFLQCLARDIKSFLRDLRKSRQLGEEVCGPNSNTQYRGMGWMLWSCVRCIFVEYPKVFGLGLELPDNTFREMLQNVFWIASASLPGVIPGDSNTWLRTNPDAFPGLWVSSLLSPAVQNNEALSGQMIDIMLLSETNIENPLVKSPNTNAFSVRSLLQIPLDVFSRKDRIRIRQSWLYAPKGPGEKEDASQSPSYELTALNSEVLSLKSRIMQLPPSYEGMKYEDLIHLAEALANPKVPISNPQVNLAEFKRLAELTLFHMTANLDQPRSQEYVSDVISHIREKSKTGSGEKVKHKDRWNFALVTLLQVVLTALSAKATALDSHGIISDSELESIADLIKKSLLAQLKRLLEKGKKSSKSSDENGKDLQLLCIIDALSALSVDGTKLAKLADEVESFIASLKETEHEVATRLATFMSIHARDADGELLNKELAGDTSTIYGRQGISEKVTALAKGKNQQQKLDLLKLTFGDEMVGLSQLDKLLAARQVIMTCEDSRRSSKDDEDDEEAFDLSKAYSILCDKLWKATSVRQFLLLSETMEMMLRTKVRSISQWNIDSTLGSITIICSRSGPSLRPIRAGTIYLHLCHLFQAVLTEHRLKLQGHFHLVVQCMQALLRCLFIPLPHTSTKFAKLFPTPPWLASPRHQLKALHAAAFTRLVTLICDPSVSSVARAQHNNLTSATDKAKRMAGQHMQFVLTTYIKFQLEMRMLPEVREKMVPGLYAIFDTTTPEMRRMIGDGLDSSGRAVFGTLYRDYLKFGKWKGS